MTSRNQAGEYQTRSYSELSQCKVSIILPACNEERRICDCLFQLLQSLSEEYEIIIAADGCTDSTIELATLFPVKIVAFQERLGKGGGILNALRVAEGEAIVISDVDLSASPSQIPQVVNALQDADIALGSRNLKDSVIPVKPPIHRTLLGKTFNWLFRRLFHIRIFDTQCGLKAVKRHVLEDLSNDLSVDGFAFDVDLIVKAHHKGFSIQEVPIMWSYKEGSKVNCLRQIYTMGKDLLRVWLEAHRKEVKTRNFKEFYDSIPGDVYEKACNSWFLPRRFWHGHKNKEVVKRVEGKDILEVGCGSGTIVKRLLETGKNVTAIDIGKQFVSFCHSKYGTACFCKTDAQYLPFSDNSFDTIVCSEVIEHLDNPEKTLKEFNRVLRQKGKLVLTTPNICFRWALVEAVWTRIRRKMLETRHKCFTRKRLNLLLDRQGFSVLHNDSLMFGCLHIVEAQKENIELDINKIMMEIEESSISSTSKKALETVSIHA
jgi:2-polyprenyl-3-methyl-5-hydroxy-6-metoxy-1,4-benzoquinol methylase